MFKNLAVLVTLFLTFTSTVKAQVVINEFSSSTSFDWIELYGFEDTDMSGWILDDFDTSTNIKVFPSGTIIGPSSIPFLVEDVGNRLNNSGDVIVLYNVFGTKADEIPYGDKGGVCIPTEIGSVGRYPDAVNVVERFRNFSRNASNNLAELDPCPTPTLEPTNTTTPTPKPSSTPKPTNTPVLTSIPTQNKIPTAKLKEEQSVESDLLSEQSDNRNYEVLGIKKNDGVNDEYLPETENKKENFPFIAGVFIIVGMGLISFPVIVFLKQSKKR